MKEEGMEEVGRRLMKALAEVPDPRSGRGIHHPLKAIMAMSVCHRPVGKGASGVGPNSGIQPGADSLRSDAAPRVPEVGRGCL